MNAPIGPEVRGTAARRAQRAGTSVPKTTKTTRATKTTKSAATKPTMSNRRMLDPDALAALEEERDFLLASLTDLEREHDAGDVDDVDYESLKDAYTSRAAVVLRSIADRHELIARSGEERSLTRTLLVLTLVAVLSVGAGWVVFRNAGTRAPGQGLTGDARQDSANLILQAQSATGQASAALGEGDGAKALKFFESAISAYDKALELSPANTEALTYRGWVLHTIAVNSEAAQAAQLDSQALVYLDRAIAIDPTYADARVFRAILERNAKDYAAAKADLDAVDMNAIPPFMTNLVNSVRTELESVGG
jgi:tetratricopeptide (TPR) repeat protein